MIIEIPKKRLDKTDEIALHHGFKFLKTPEMKTNDDPFLSVREKEAIIQRIKPEIKTVEPILIYHDQPVLQNKKISPKKDTVLNLDIVGVSGSVAEAMVINTSLKILKEAGYKNNVIEINCTGDKESIVNFTDELLSYYKKNSLSIDNDCKKFLTKKNIAILNCNHKGCCSVQKIAPRPINFLSDRSRQHFKEVLEYLEEMEIPYEINDELISENNHYSKTIFEIKNKTKDQEILLARGGRYDETANKIANKRNLVAVGVSMRFKKEKGLKAYSNKIQAPQILLIQFGFKAKLKSFEVIEILRQQQVTILQNLHKNKLSEQFEIAKKIKVPYIITIGQKEATDNEIIFRNNIDDSTHIIKIKKLPQFLRKIKIV